MATQNKAGTTVITGKCRLVYPHVFEPYSSDPDKDPRYSVMLLIPKSDKRTIKALRDAEEEAKQAGVMSKWNGRMPKGMLSIIHDGDDEDQTDTERYPERAGHWYMTVGSVRRPGVVDQDVLPILDASEIYSGCYGRVELGAFPYSVSGKNGVTFGLNNLQKLADGEVLGGRSRPEDVFSRVARDEEDEDLL